MNETTKIDQFWAMGKPQREKFTINLLFLLIVLVILATILGSIFSGSKLPDPEGKALVVNPQGPIVEQVSSSLDPLSFCSVWASNSGSECTKCVVCFK